MPPPPYYADLSKKANDVFSKGYHFGVVKLDLKTKSQAGVEFTSGITSTRESGKFFEKKGVPDVKSGDELFKSITGFDEVDVNLLEGVHTTYNSLSSRFEIAPDDNRNISYPFEYCWNKSNEGKAKSDKSGDEEVEDNEDEFEEMWNHSIKKKTVDSATNFGNILHVEDPTTPVTIDKKVNFATEIKVSKPDDNIRDTSIQKKS